MRAMAVTVLAAALAAGCAARQPHVDERNAALARPEPDPSCHGTVRGLLDVNGLEQVVVKVTVTAEGRPSLVEVLTPDLTPMAAVEVRRAFERCAWKPAVGPDGERVEGSLTLAVRR